MFWTHTTTKTTVTRNSQERFPFSGERMNKFLKIASYLRKNWERIYWLSDTDHDYISQILDYTEHAEHDDAADSAASLVRYLIEKPTANVNPCLIGGL